MHYFFSFPNDCGMINVKIIGEGNSSCTKGHVPDNKHVIGLYGAYIMAMVGSRGARRSNTQRRRRKGVFVSAAAARRRAPVFLGGGVKS